MLTRANIQEFRGPEAARDFFNEICSFIEAGGQVEKYKSTKRVGLYNKFWGEFYPLMVYMNKIYPREKVIGRIILGNQPFDAEIYHAESDKLLEKIEFTEPIDWWWYLKKLKSFEDFYDNSDLNKYISDSLKIAFLTARHKSLNDYSGSTLVFCIDNKDDEDNRIFRSLRKYIKKLNFRADKVGIVTYPRNNPFGSNLNFVKA